MMQNLLLLDLLRDVSTLGNNYGGWVPNVRLLVQYHATGKNEVSVPLNYPLCISRFED